MRTPTAPTRPQAALLISAIALTAIGFAAAWVMLAHVSQGPALWMMPLAALDMAMILALFAEPSGRRRALLAGAGTAFAIGLGLWLLNAVQFGRMFGLAPLAAIERFGPRLAWHLIRASAGTNGGALAAGCILAAGIWGLGAVFSARRRSP